MKKTKSALNAMGIVLTVSLTIVLLVIVQREKYTTDYSKVKLTTFYEKMYHC